MIIEYDEEDRCIRVNDVAVSYGEAEELLNEHETAAAALENALVPCGTKSGAARSRPKTPER